MKNKFYVLFLSLFSINLFCQNQIIEKNDIQKLNSIIKVLEKDYQNKETRIYKSLPQASANYFKIITNKPDDFLASLKNSENFEQLIKENPNLQIDKDLLIIKNTWHNYKNEKKIEIKSFDIEKSRSHRIEINFTDSINKNNIQFLYSIHKRTWSKYKSASIIQGFYLNKEFKSIDLPSKFSDWVNYTDIIVKPNSSIFLNQDEKKNTYINKSIINSLVKYYEEKTKKPPYIKEQDYILYNNKISLWQSKKKQFSDSLYKSDKKFKKLLQEALLFAEKNKVSNGDLEDFTAHLISKKRALNLMRLNQQVGTCSFDNGPIIQQKRIAQLAVKTLNWDVFIQSFLNVMNDNVSRVANSNIATNSRKTYINELEKLNFNLNKVLLDSNLRIKDTANNHYFSNGNKIAKAYAKLNSEYQQYFEKTVSNIIRNKSIDAFNKLHFYNTYKNYQYFLKDTIKKREVKNKIKNLVKFLPLEIKSRIDNPNKQLYDLLHREKNELNNFTIKSSSIASIYSFTYDGDCWQAELFDKGSNGKIIYDLTMPNGKKTTPLKEFLNKKNELKSRVQNHTFLQKILNKNSENKLYIKFTKDRSFTNYKNNITREMPKELISTLDFNDAISIYIKHPKRMYVSYILLKNNNLLILGIPKGFNLLTYSFETLMTIEKEEFLSKSYFSYKLFNIDGEMLN